MDERTEWCEKELEYITKEACIASGGQNCRWWELCWR